MRRRPCKNSIPDEDAPLIDELLKTLTIPEIAVKWEVDAKTVKLFMKRHNISSARAKKRYRIEYINSNPRESIDEIAKHLNCRVSLVENIILRGDE